MLSSARSTGLGKFPRIPAPESAGAWPADAATAPRPLPTPHGPQDSVPTPFQVGTPAWGPLPSSQRPQRSSEAVSERSAAGLALLPKRGARCPPSPELAVQRRQPEATTHGCSQQTPVTLSDGRPQSRAPALPAREIQRPGLAVVLNHCGTLMRGVKTCASSRHRWGRDLANPTQPTRSKDTKDGPTGHRQRAQGTHGTESGSGRRTGLLKP